MSFSDAELEEVRARAKAQGRSLADYIYRLVMAPAAPCNCGKDDG